MIDVGMKPHTARRAKAGGWIRMRADALALLKENQLPKPDALATARAAALLAAKRTPELIPHCHPLMLDKVKVDFDFGDTDLWVTAEVACTASTGVEMEALTAASVALLTVYDMCKAVDDKMEIGGIVVMEKDGGKSDFSSKAPGGFRAAVIITSDRCSKGLAPDKTGPMIMAALEQWGVAEPEYLCLPDDKAKIKEAFEHYCAEGFDLVISSGGTGLSPRDVTVEAAGMVIERELPGIMEAARAFGQRRTPYAMLSRGIAGQKGKTLILTLPGSSGGVRESLAALYPYLFHAHPIMKAGVH